MRRLLIVLAALALSAVLAPPARAGGLGPGDDVGPGGVAVAGHDSRYVALFHGGRTLVLRIERRGGRVVAYASLRRRAFVTAASWDAAPTGLSGDGRTLVLSGADGVFTVLDTRSMHVREKVWLEGELTLHAVSREGDVLFLNANGAILAYDLAAGRLRPDSVVALPDAGMPLSFTPSRDGRWAYTLYDGAGRAPFLLALDTATARARTIPLPRLADRDNTFGLAVRLLREGRVAVHERDTGARLLVVDPAATPSRPPRAPAATAEPTRASAATWPLAVAGLAVLALIGAALRVRGV